LVYDARRLDVIFVSPALALVLTYVLTGASPSPALAQPAPPSGLTFPREEPGACPFECCRYGMWTATSAVTARRARAGDAPPAFRVAAGETVEVPTGVVVTLQPGRARAREAVTLDGVRLAPGEEVPVLRYAGEGAWVVWAGGRALATEAEEAGGPLRVLSRPRTVWWVQIRNWRGETGWSDQPERFSGSDACG
jgi:hypothetical protein